MAGGEWRPVLRIFGIGLAALALSLLVLFAGYWIGKSSGFYDAQANGYSYQDREATSRRVGNCFGKAQSRTVTARCAEEAIKAGHEHSRSEHDLTAQREMADWTWWLLIVAFIQTPITAVGIVLLLRNIQQADDALVETRRIGEAQTRAYLSISGCQVMFRVEKMSIRPMLQNSGQSPALDVTWHAYVNLIRKDDKGSRAGETRPDYRKFRYDVPAQGERQALYCDCVDFFVGNEELAAFQDDIGVNIIVEVRAEGKDVFGHDISTDDYFIYTLFSPPEDGDQIDCRPGTRVDRQEADKA